MIKMLASQRNTRMERPIDQVPTVSIGMPVYNGEKYICEALDSLLSQTFTDFELIISDNASTDDTQAICERYAARDGRIRYVKQQKWLTAYDNFYYCRGQARGDFFMWSAVDDYHPPNFIEALVDSLGKNSAAILACGTILVVKNDAPVSTAVDISFSFSTKGKSILFRLAAISKIQCFHIYGLWRTNAIRAIPYSYCNWWADLAMLMSASVLGEFVDCPETSFVYREIQKTDVERAKYQDGQTGHKRINSVLGLVRATFFSVKSTGGVGLAVYAVSLIVIRQIRRLPGFIWNRMKEKFGK